MAAGNNQRSVTVEMDRGNRQRVSLDDVVSLPRFHVPNPNRLIKRSGDDEVGMNTEIDTEDKIGVAAKGFDALGGACVPDAEGFVVRGGADVV